mmetsp:Transcript_5676/g.16210  ORF Transcript_5676/g.16210 Transcript_5676/m.16210 type:complete len:804 (-) Transcript_5676:2762-5173(-)
MALVQSVGTFPPLRWCRRQDVTGTFSKCSMSAQLGGIGNFSHGLQMRTISGASALARDTRAGRCCAATAYNSGRICATGLSAVHARQFLLRPGLCSANGRPVATRGTRRPKSNEKAEAEHSPPSPEGPDQGTEPHAQNISSPAQTPVPVTKAAAGGAKQRKESRTEYLARLLSNPEDKLWSAAGNLLYQLSKDGEMSLLLGRPMYQAGPTAYINRNKANCWNLLGGKRESNDATASDTACREMWEESGGLLSENNLSVEAEETIWYPDGKYAVFIRQVKGLESLPTEFAALKRRPWNRNLGMPRPTLDLAWVLLDDITNENNSLRKHIFLRGLFRQTHLVTWLLRRRQHHRVELGLAGPESLAQFTLPSSSYGVTMSAAQQTEWDPEAQLASSVAMVRGNTPGIAADDDSELNAKFDASTEDEEDVDLVGAQEAAEHEDFIIEQEQQEAQRTVDNSLYGDAGALPPKLIAAIEAQDAKPVRQVTKARARALWREAVSEAFLGPPTPYTLAGWTPPLACPNLTGPRDVGGALTTAFLKVSCSTQLIVAKQLEILQEHAYLLMLRGSSILEAEMLLGTAHVAEEHVRQQIVWQLRHTLLLCGRGVPAKEVLSEVLAEEAAYMDVSSFTSQTADGAARSEVGAKDVGQSESPQHTGAQDSAGLQQIASQPPRSLRENLKFAIVQLLRGQMAPGSGMPWNDQAMLKALQHLRCIDPSEISELCKVALVGFRRRRGRSIFMPNSAYATQRSIVSELLVASNAYYRVQTRLSVEADNRLHSDFDASKVSLVDKLMDRRIHRHRSHRFFF